MANKDQQRRGNREARKPKQPKTKPTVQASPFAAIQAAQGQATQGQTKPGRKV
jgi:hypothetical protein